MKRKSNNFLSLAIISIIILGFIFYLFNAESFLFFGNQKRQKQIADIKYHYQKNLLLNKQALKNPEEKSIIKSANSNIYLSIEKMPKYKSCEYFDEAKAQLCTVHHINHYFSKIVFPPEIIIKVDKVFVQFIVDDYGYIQNPRIIKSKQEEINQIVLEHIKNMPKFAKPGFHDNIAVNVQYSLPFNIKK